jgi:hypothetical protein
VAQQLELVALVLRVLMVLLLDLQMLFMITHFLLLLHFLP